MKTKNENQTRLRTHGDHRSSVSVTRSGDIWLMGLGHKVICGNPLHRDDYESLMAGRRAATVFMDPPRELGAAEFMLCLRASLSRLIPWSLTGSPHYICVDWPRISETVSAAHAVNLELEDICVWIRSGARTDSLYRCQRDVVLVFGREQPAHDESVRFGFPDGHASFSVYASLVATSRPSNKKFLGILGLTAKSVGLVANAIVRGSSPLDIVLDPFLGDGDSLLAAEQSGRVCYGMEIDPLMVDSAVRRWQQLTGEKACRLDDAKDFDEVEQEVRHGR